MACEAVDSSDVKTSGMHADFGVWHEGGATSRAQAILRVGGVASNTFVDLSDGDSLDVTDSDGTHALSRQSLGDLITYNYDSSDTAEGDTFSFAFTRADDTSAPESTAVLPAPFDLAAPTADAAVSRAAELVVTWSPTSADPMEVEVAGDCFFGKTELQQNDAGTVTFPAGTFEAFEGREGESCEGTVKVRRYRNGTVDAAFGSGTARGYQQRVIDIRSDP